LAHKILVSCSPARVLSKSVEICGPKFISFDKVGVFPFFEPISRFRSEMCAFFTARCSRFLVFDVKASLFDSITLSVLLLGRKHFGEAWDLWTRHDPLSFKAVG